MPVDDENTLSITWQFGRVPHEREPYRQDKIPTWEGPIADPRSGRWLTSHVMNQDFVTWVGQGQIANRAEEYLAPSDRGIVMIRRRASSRMSTRSRSGKDPKATVRDPAINESIELPVAERGALVDGFSRAQLMRDAFNRRSLQGYIFQTGQPKDVHDAYLAAMSGINRSDIDAAEVAIDPLAPVAT